jgi:diguanylate cyclase (GGDEF)-like protein
LVGAVQDVTDQREAAEQLRRLAYQDSTTGLPNRRQLQVQLATATSAANGFALILIGLDGFKTVNDIHGHLVGDRLLQTVARRLQASIRPNDVAARLAGDEFAVILYNTFTIEQAEQRATMLLAAVRDNIDEEGALTATVSIGIALQQPDVSGPDELLTRADIALNRAKSMGRNRSCAFLPQYRTELEARYHLLADVRRALKRREFEVYYQPIIDLRNHRVLGLEALIRWRHPTRGLLPPLAFQAALQDPGTSVAIDEFVLGESLRQLRVWLDAGVPLADTGMNVNVAAAQLQRPDLIPFITATLARYDLAPEQLKLEVLETAFLGSETKAVASAIQALAELGVVSALDDFGTGYASLTHLKQLKIERIKIDHSFISTLCSNEYDRTIVKSMIGLGCNLGIKVTAEGVETVEQLQMLRDLDCDCAQGYLFARPLHPADVPAALADWYKNGATQLLGVIVGSSEVNTLRPKKTR